MQSPLRHDLRRHHTRHPEERIRTDVFQRHGAFSWCELMATDVDAAKAFYMQLLRWTTEDLSTAGMPFTMVKTDDTGVGGIMPMPRRCRLENSRVVWPRGRGRGHGVRALRRAGVRTPAWRQAGNPGRVRIDLASLVKTRNDAKLGILSLMSWGSHPLFTGDLSCVPTRGTP
jgi:hypothetical protein